MYNITLVTMPYRFENLLNTMAERERPWRIIILLSPLIHRVLPGISFTIEFARDNIFE